MLLRTFVTPAFGASPHRRVDHVIVFNEAGLLRPTTACCSVEPRPR
jgi:hypothetical protein